jgi:hypothetical protein
MDSRQAKEILLLYREGIDPADDPQVIEALALAQRESELAQWLEQQRIIHTKVRTALSQIEPPEGLREQIVSERRLHTSLSGKRKAVLAVAAVAGMVLAASLLISQIRPEGENKKLSGFQNRMAGIVLRSYPKMDLETNDIGQIRAYLARQGRGDYGLPPTLDKTPGTGCKVLSWQNHPVSMICFNSGKTTAAGNPDLFLFVMDQAAVPDSAAANRQIGQLSKLSTLSWTLNGKIYFLGALGTAAQQVQTSVAADIAKL